MPVGAPLGNDNAERGTRWRNAIDTALNNRCKSDGQKALVAIAEAMLAKAAQGDMTAIKELGDRVDGKVAQSHEVGNKDGETFKTESIVRTIVDPKHTDS